MADIINFPSNDYTPLLLEVNDTLPERKTPFDFSVLYFIVKHNDNIQVILHSHYLISYDGVRMCKPLLVPEIKEILRGYVSPAAWAALQNMHTYITSIDMLSKLMDNAIGDRLVYVGVRIID